MSQKTRTLYRVVLPYAIFALEADERGCIALAAPIAKWAYGKPTETVLAYFRRKGAQIECLGTRPIC